MGCTKSSPGNIRPADPPPADPPLPRDATPQLEVLLPPVESNPSLSLSTIVPVRVLQRQVSGGSILLGFSEAIVDEDGLLPLTMIVDPHPPLNAGGGRVLYGTGVAQILPTRSGLFLPCFGVFVEPLPHRLTRFLNGQTATSSPDDGAAQELACISVFPSQPNSLRAVCEGHGFGLLFHQFLAYGIQLCAAYEELQRCGVLPLGAPLDRLLIKQNGNLCFAAFSHLVEPEHVHEKYVLSNACLRALEGVEPKWLSPEVHDAIKLSEVVDVTHQWQWELGQALSCLCSLGGVLEDYPDNYRQDRRCISFTLEHSSYLAERHGIRLALKQRQFTDDVLNIIMDLTRCDPLHRCTIAAAKSRLVTALRLARGDTTQLPVAKVAPRPANFLQNRATPPAQRIHDDSSLRVSRQGATLSQSAQATCEVMWDFDALGPGLDGAAHVVHDVVIPNANPPPHHLYEAINIGTDPCDGIVAALGGVFVAKPTAGTVCVRYQSAWFCIFACQSPRFLARRPTADRPFQLVVYDEARREFHVIQANGGDITRNFDLIATISVHITLPAGYPYRDSPVTCMAASAGHLIFAQGRNVRVFELFPNGEFYQRLRDVVATHMALEWGLNISEFQLTGVWIDEPTGTLYTADNCFGAISTYTIDDGQPTANYFSGRGLLEHCRSFVVDSAHDRIYAVGTGEANVVHVIDTRTDSCLGDRVIRSETARFFPKYAINNLALAFDDDGSVSHVLCSYMHPISAGFSSVYVR